CHSLQSRSDARRTMITTMAMTTRMTGAACDILLVLTVHERKTGALPSDDTLRRGDAGHGSGVRSAAPLQDSSAGPRSAHRPGRVVRASAGAGSCGGARYG